MSLEIHGTRSRGASGEREYKKKLKTQKKLPNPDRNFSHVSPKTIARTKKFCSEAPKKKSARLAAGFFLRTFEFLKLKT